MPSRRSVLAGLLASGAVGLGSRVRLDRFEPTAVPSDTWPRPRYDHRNTARAPVTVPSAPGVAWRTEARGTGDAVGLVVGRERVFVGTAHVHAFDRVDGTERWSAIGVGGRCALGTDHLYVSESQSGSESPRLRAFDREGTVQWDVELRPADSVLPLSSGVLTSALGGALRAFGTDGRSRAGTRHGGHGSLAVAAGTLYGAGPYAVQRYQRPTVADATVGRFPDSQWTSDLNAARTTLTVHDGALLVGNRQSTVAVEAFDLEAGQRRWRVAPTPGDDEVSATRAPVVVDGTAVTATAVETGSDRRTWRLLGVDAASGERRWRRPLDSAVRDVAAGEEAVLLATGHDRMEQTGIPRGSVRAFDVTGAPQWRTTFDVPVRTLALADGTVFALLADGSVAALRA
ncbi:hypothetical protein NDI56_08185 [Haloarcula sp. S1CR25-12]|uniref:Pyrrolo-quinoline quinone repeat domain-containing protein n=1 Tax=Haloarcula saliterrae TaxID=2950534 RepID=A0ABU2FAR8_9EURY|nr:PQQ-binding-like beta-propeller repeat protein [Haloarcula sp. S1CR25-12]MDS0259367.1 hypothetical protein [Haloarcula sp. S1CR25-12]